MISSYVGENKIFEQQFLSGQLEVELCPQGTLAERLRAGGAGIEAFFTPTGYGTKIAEGKETREINGRRCVLEHAIRGDFAIVKAWRGDRWGNLVFRKTSRNFNPLCAAAGKITIAEVEELVEVGELDPDQVHLPVDLRPADLPGHSYEKPIEQRTVRRARSRSTSMPASIAIRWPAASPPSCATASTSTSASACRRSSPTSSRPASTSCCSRERPARHRPVPLRGRRGSRPHQRRQADRHDDQGLGVLRLGAVVRDDPRRHVDVSVLGAMEVSRAATSRTG
jgi:hypothetical protein